MTNERVKGLKQEISNLNKDKDDINDGIDKKEKLNNKIVIKSKNKMQDEINKLTEENIHLKFENKQYKEKYEELEEKTNYLVDHLNKVFEKLPEFIQKIVKKSFNNLEYIENKVNNKQTLESVIIKDVKVNFTRHLFLFFIFIHYDKNSS